RVEALVVHVAETYGIDGGHAVVVSRRAHRRYSSASVRLSSRPSPGRVGSGRSAPSHGASGPSKSNASTRTWSANHSRWRARGTPLHACALTCGAVWADRSRLR